MNLRLARFILKPVGAEAGDALARVHALAFAIPWDAASIAAQLRSPFIFALAAYDTASPGPADGAVGFILVQAVAGEAEILTLAVDPAVRRQGVGAALVEGAAGLALAAGAAEAWLEVAEDNGPARALYRAAGFTIHGRRPRYYARPGGGAGDALVLRRLLNTEGP